MPEELSEEDDIEDDSDQNKQAQSASEIEDELRAH